MKAQLPTAAQRAQQGQEFFSHKVSFLIPTYNTDPTLLHELVDSLLDQTCPLWEACFYDGASPSDATRQALLAEAARDARIRVTLGEENLGISGNTNKAAEMAQHDVLALCDHDDLLTPDAVYCLLKAAEAGADLIYSDEDKCNQAGTFFFDPHFKPDYSPYALRSGNYICHLMATTRSLWDACRGLDSRYDGSQDFDLTLRLAEKAQCILHIPRVLYHWRQLETSVSHQKAIHCAEVAAQAVNEHLSRMELPGQADLTVGRLGRNFPIKLDFPETEDIAVSLIVCGTCHQPVRWAHKLLLRTKGRPLEILWTDMEVTHPQLPSSRTIKTVGDRWSKLNQAAKEAKG